MNYTPVSLKEQNKILKKHFGISVKTPSKLPNLPSKAEHYFVVPQWEKIGTTYNEAVEKVLMAIKKTRPFYNWREGQLGPKYLRRRERTVPEIVACQFGELHKGKSVETVRTNQSENEMLLGAYEIGIMLLTHTDRLNKYENLWIDCAGDDYSPGADGDFSLAPGFYWIDGGLKFGTSYVDDTDEYFGTVSGFINGTVLESDICKKEKNQRDLTTSTMESDSDVTIEIPVVIKIMVPKVLSVSGVRIEISK